MLANLQAILDKEQFQTHAVNKRNTLQAFAKGIIILPKHSFLRSTLEICA